MKSFSATLFQFYIVPTAGSRWVFKVFSLIEFDDGEEREIDFQPVLAGEIYGALQDEKMFHQIEIDPEAHTLVWPKGADFDPETLHDWPKYVEEMERMARQWAMAQAEAV